MIFEIKRNNEIPIHQQIQIYIKDQIKAGAFQVGEKIPSARTLGDSLQVSHLTVRQALKNLEAEGLLESRIGQGTFVASTSMFQGKVAVLFSSIHNEFSQSISRSILTQLHQKEIDFELIDCMDDIKVRNKHYQRVIDGEFSGAIIIEPEVDGESIFKLLELVLKKLPLVLVDRYIDKVPCSCVQSDNVLGGYLATKHMISQGKKRIAFVGGRKFTTIAQRIEGYRQAISEEEGIACSQDMVKSFENRKLRDVMSELITLSPHPDAIFFENDYTALEGLKYLLQAGLKVPGDVAIVGFDDVSVSAHSTPSLTTIKQNPTLMAEAAVELYSECLSSINKGEDLPIKTVSIPVELMARDSS